MTDHTAIYAIVHDGGDLYVGSALRLWERWGGHLSTLRRGIHRNCHLQHAWDKYGEESFHFTVLEECAPSDLLMREQHWMDELEPEYNIAIVAGNPMLGRAWSPESRAKLSASKMGHEVSMEARAKLAEANIGKTASLATRDKMRQARIGYRSTDESRAKMAEAAKGRPRNPQGKFCRTEQ
jgi:group I intron endonuclease